MDEPCAFSPVSLIASHDRGLPRLRISRKTGYKIFDRYKEHGL